MSPSTFVEFRRARCRCLPTECTNITPGFVSSAVPLMNRCGFILISIVAVIVCLSYLSPSKKDGGDEELKVNALMVVVPSTVPPLAHFMDTTTATGETWLREKGEDLQRRSDLVRKACERRGEAARWTVAPGSMMIDDRHKLGYCRHGKAATSTILRHFLTLSESVSAETKLEWQDDEHKLHVNVPGLFKPQDEEGVKYMSQMLRYLKEKEIYTFSFVRHPFERLVSAFENKILYTPSFAGKYLKLSEQLGTNFTDFVDYVLSQHAQSRDCLRGYCGMDVHWKPFYGRCAYCDVPYHAIGKVETFDEDLLFVVQSAGLEELLPEAAIDDVKMNSVPHQEARGREYFASLDHERRQRLFDVYEFDFQLFGYDADGYL